MCAAGGERYGSGERGCTTGRTSATRCHAMAAPGRARRDVLAVNRACGESRAPESVAGRARGVLSVRRAAYTLTERCGEPMITDHKKISFFFLSRRVRCNGVKTEGIACAEELLHYRGLSEIATNDLLPTLQYTTPAHPTRDLSEFCAHLSVSSRGPSPSASSQPRSLHPVQAAKAQDTVPSRLDYVKVVWRADSPDQSRMKKRGQ